MRSYFAASMALAALAAVNFGTNTVNFSTSKEFVILDFEWCKGESSSFLCSKGTTYGSIITGAVFWGAAIGSCFIGLLGKYGRRKGLILINSVNIVASLTSAGAMCFSMLLFGRILAGLTVGATGLVPMYLSEICPSDKRGTYGIIYPLFIVSGQLFMVLWQLIHGRIPIDTANEVFAITNLDRFVWRSAQFWPGIFSVVALLLLLFIVKDDTPYVLLSEGKEEDAKRVIGLLHGEDKVETVMAEIKTDQEAMKGGSDTRVGVIGALKNPKFRGPLLIMVGASIMQQVSGINVFVANASKIFVAIMGRSFISTVVGCTTVLVLLIGTIICGFIIDKYDRRTMFMVGIGISSITLVPSIIIKLAATPATWVNIVLALGCLGYCFGFSLGMGGVLWLYFAEALGTEYKDAGYGLATCCNWISGGIIVTSSDALLAWNENFTYSFYGTLTLVGLAYMYFLIKETRGIPLGQAYA